MHPLRYTLYKILDGKKLRALSFHGRSQTMYTRQYSQVSLTISLYIYIFYNNHSHSRMKECLTYRSKYHLSKHTWRKSQKKVNLASRIEIIP